MNLTVFLTVSNLPEYKSQSLQEVVPKLNVCFSLSETLYCNATVLHETHISRTSLAWDFDNDDFPPACVWLHATSIELLAASHRCPILGKYLNAFEHLQEFLASSSSSSILVFLDIHLVYWKEWKAKLELGIIMRNVLQ